VPAVLGGGQYRLFGGRPVNKLLLWESRFLLYFRDILIKGIRSL
jgi:hypothetical protein